MSVPLRVVERPVDDDGYTDPWSAETGDTWLCDSRQHHVDGRGPCWVIRLPGRAWTFHTNMPATNGAGYWTVTGEVPHLTVAPSIDVGPGIWHGWIRDGALTPDEATEVEIA